MARTFKIEMRDEKYEYNIYLKQGFFSLRPYAVQILFRREGDKEWKALDVKEYELLGCYVGRNDLKGYLQGDYPEKLINLIGKEIIKDIKKGGRIVFRTKKGISLGYIVEYIKYSELKGGAFKEIVEMGERNRRDSPQFEPAYRF